MKVIFHEFRQATGATKLPFFSSKVAAGFPSPADDYLQKLLDLNEHLVKHPSATFIVEAVGSSMIGAGIQPGALLIVDRSLKAKHNDIVIASLNGEFTCKILDMKGKALRAANPDFPPILLPEGSEIERFGVVIHAVNKLCSRS